MPTTSPDTSLTQSINNRLDDLIALRHDLHRHPQLAYQETYASGRVQNWLTEHDIPFQAGVAETGVVAWIMPEDDHARAKPAVALRADMDALPIHEATGLEYASKYHGFMHACGHDGHTTILLGAAATLNERRASLKHPIKLLFQPAEEMAAGGRRMVEDHALDAQVGGVAASRIFGLHGWTGVPVGHVAVRSGPAMAASDGFTITVHGCGGHAAAPHFAADPIVAAAAVITAIQTIVARNVKPTDAAVITVAQHHAGSANNVIPDQAVLSGTIRSLDPKVAQLLYKRLQEVAEQTAAAMGCKAQFELRVGYPVLVNDAACAQNVLRVARATLGDPATHESDTAVMGAEDFAFYTQQIPGAFFFLGIEDGGEPHPRVHTPRFDFNDRAIPTGIQMMCALALDDA